MQDDELFAHLVSEALKHGARVEIDGLGVFQRDDENNYSFERKSIPKVFIAYAHEDAAAAERLFDGFTASGFAPWMDRRKLLPGQNWPRAIQNALETSDFVVTCFPAIPWRRKAASKPKSATRWIVVREFRWTMST